MEITNVTDYIALNYNHDIDYFWDLESPIMNTDMQNYMKKKLAINAGDSNYETLLQKLQAAVRKDLLGKIGNERKEIESEHLRLSSAFGFPVGIIKTVRLSAPKSILGIFSEIIHLTGSKTSKNQLTTSNFLEGPKLENFFENPYSINFLVLLTVIYLNIKSIYIV